MKKVYAAASVDSNGIATAEAGVEPRLWHLGVKIDWDAGIRFRELSRALDMTQPVFMEYMINNFIVDADEFIEQQLEQRRKDLQKVFNKD